MKKVGPDEMRDAKPIKKRHWWLAALLSLLCPGLGQLYATKAKRGLICFGIMAGIAATGFLLLHVPPKLFALVIVVVIFSVLAVLAQLSIIVDAAVGARRIGEVSLKKYNRLYVYLAAVFASVIVNQFWDPRPFATRAWENYSIPAASMNPTVMKGDYVVSWNEYYEAHEPKRGDIAIFKLPTDMEIDYIKRLVGLPGDRIQMRDGILQINGTPIERELVAERQVPGFSGELQNVAEYIETLPGGARYSIWEESDQAYHDNTPEYQVPPEHYFALADNRDQSVDSRAMEVVGFIPRENLRDFPTFIFWSSDRSRIGTAVQPLP